MQLLLSILFLRKNDHLQQKDKRRLFFGNSSVNCFPLIAHRSSVNLTCFLFLIHCSDEIDSISNLYKFDARPYVPDRRPLNEVPRPLDYNQRPLKEIPRPFDFDRRPTNELPRPLDYRPAEHDRRPPIVHGYPHRGQYDAFDRKDYPDDSIRGGYPATRPEDRFVYSVQFPSRRPTDDDFYNNRNVPWTRYPNRRLDHDIGNI